MNLFNFIPGYDSAIYSQGREPAFIMLLAFVLTFIITRGYTRIARKTGWGSASVGGVHTHHMVFGLVIAFVAGALMFAFLPNDGPFQLLLAAMFGIGASLVLDEFALIFHLQDVYWEKEGRKSVDAVVLGLAFGLLFFMQLKPFGAEANSSHAVIAILVAINLPIVLIAALKGKIYFAIFGVFIPTVSLIGAIRLAEPNSVWSRKFYSNKPKKIKKSQMRYKKYDKEWKIRKEKLWDIIGGKIGRPQISK